MKKVLQLIGIIGLGWLLAGCGGPEAVAPGAAAGIVCTAAYRSSTATGIEQEETFTFSDADDELWATFGELMFHAAYDAGGADNERNLRVWVTDAAQTAVYHRTLYQFSPHSGPQNQFVGGHGFTGLHYSYAPGEPAELQYWCAAQ